MPQDEKTSENSGDLVFRFDLIPRVGACGQNKLGQQILGVHYVFEGPCRSLFRYYLVDFCYIVLDLYRDVILDQ